MGGMARAEEQEAQTGDKEKLFTTGTAQPWSQGPGRVGLCSLGG